MNFLDEITKDNISGSIELLQKINKYFLEIFGDVQRFNTSIKLLSDNFSNFATINNYLSEIQKLNREEVYKFLLDFENRNGNKFSKIYLNFKENLRDRIKILTISNSQTLFNVFKLALNDFPNLEFFISESRPVNEGRMLANKLSNLTENVSLITEAMQAEFVQKSDMCIIGCDKILFNGNVVNKIGSKNLAVLSKYYGKKFFVLGDKSKITEENNLIQNIHNSLEIQAEACNYKIADNIYFEEIPKELITKVILDQ